MASRQTRLRINVHSNLRLCPSFKVAFKDKSDALDCAESMMSSGSVSPGCHITPYQCHECGRWHVRNKRIFQ